MKGKKKSNRKAILIYINEDIAAKVLQFSRILGLSRSIIIENMLTQWLVDNLAAVEKELLLLTRDSYDTNTNGKGGRQSPSGQGLTARNRGLSNTGDESGQDQQMTEDVGLIGVNSEDSTTSREPVMITQEPKISGLEDILQDSAERVDPAELEQGGGQEDLI